MPDSAKGSSGNSPDAPLIEESLKRAELSLKMADAALKQADLRSREGWKRYLSSPLAPIVLTALIGFVFSQITSYVQFNENLSVEKEKMKSSLFLKMIETGDQKTATKNLLFLIRVGLIDDPSGKIADALRKDPTSAPVLSSPAGTVVPQSAASIQIFFELYKKSYGSPSQATIDNLSQIFELIKTDKSISDMRHVAYILATIQHETARTFAPIEEVGRGRGQPYGEKYYGRGYVQLTSEDKYQKMGDILGLDLHGAPDLALKPDIAYRIASTIMMKGLLTGKKLTDFINSDKKDYFHARTTLINSLDKAKEIAAAAEKFEEILRVSLDVRQDAASSN